MATSSYQTPLATETAGIAASAIGKGKVVEYDSTGADGHTYVKECVSVSLYPSYGVALDDYVAGDLVATVRVGECVGDIEAALTKGDALSVSATGGFVAAASEAVTLAYLQETTAGAEKATIDVVISSPLK